MKGKKTLIFAALVFLVSFSGELPGLKEHLTPEAFRWAMMLVAAGIAVLRALTKTPLFENDSKGGTP